MNPSRGVTFDGWPPAPMVQLGLRTLLVLYKGHIDDISVCIRGFDHVLACCTREGGGNDDTEHDVVFAVDGGRWAREHWRLSLIHI